MGATSRRRDPGGEGGGDEVVGLTDFARHLRRLLLLVGRSFASTLDREWHVGRCRQGVREEGELVYAVRDDGRDQERF